MAGPSNGLQKTFVSLERKNLSIPKSFDKIPSNATKCCESRLLCWKFSMNLMCEIRASVGTMMFGLSL